MATSAREWLQGNRKEVTTPSGNVAVIKKLIQRDFFPRGLVNIGFDTSDSAATNKYLRENPSVVFDQENDILMKGVVEPRLSAEATQDESVLFIGDMGESDKKFLLDAIAEWSGVSNEQQAAADKFRDEQLANPRPDGTVLPQVPA